MKKVLFVCTHNSCRSQMAAAFFNSFAPSGWNAESAGSDPGKKVDADAVKAMAETGIDISRAKPRLLSFEMLQAADKIVTMGCASACPATDKPVEDWALEDPAGKGLEKTRRIRDEIRKKTGLLAVSLKQV